MSKLVKIAIECPKCSHQYTGDFFRTIWGEHESNRNMVMEDRINIAKCPSCGHQFHLPLAMMYVDVQKGFAVWWEPSHDPGVDSDSASYQYVCFDMLARRRSVSDDNRYYSGISLLPFADDFFPVHHQQNLLERYGCTGDDGPGARRKFPQSLRCKSSS